MSSSDSLNDSILNLKSTANGELITKTLMGNGYSHNFVNNVDDFECTICSMVARDPKLIVKCGHSFCTACLDEKIGSSDDGVLLCPTDKRVFEVVDVFPDIRLERMIQGLHVYCDNKDKGCAETMKLHDLKAHLEICEYKMNYDTNIGHEKLCEIIYKLGKCRDEDRKIIDKLRSENNELKKTVDTLQTNVKCAEEKFNVQINNIHMDMEDAMTKELKINTYNRAPCTWTIDSQVTSIPAGGLWSPVFRTKGGYDMILWIGTRGASPDAKLLVECFLKSRANNNKLSWPWKEEYSVTVINTRTGSEIVKCQERGPGSPGRNRPANDTTNSYSIFDGTVMEKYQSGQCAFQVIVKSKF